MHAPIRMSFALLAVVGSALLWVTANVEGQTPLRRGQTIPGMLAEGDTARYTVDVAENTFLLGEVNQISVDVRIRILQADGTPAGGLDGLGRGRERFAGEPPTPGTYTVELTANEGEAGSYEITLLRLERVETDPRRRVDQLMSRYDSDESPGAAVRVWRDGRTVFSKAYGMANLSYGLPFEEDTRTNIGSTSKQFTAFAVQLQAERGLLSLDDDIRKHIPELPAFEHTITVRHLLTHTSGLREFLNLLRMTGRRLDRGDWIDRSELIDIVQRQPKLQNVPGAEWNYNNTAFGLAAVIVERTSGQDFATYMQEHVFGPLGMTRTMVRPSVRHMVPDQSEGYTPGPDGYLQIGDLGGAVGAGSIYASIEDLQTWVENYANPRVGSREMIDEMMTSHVLNDGEESGYGLGLSVGEQRGLKRVNHGGADVAHRSMLVYFPEINAGLTTQSNHAQFNSNVAFEIAELFFEDAMEPEAGEATAEAGGFDAEAYDPEDFDDFVGRYALDAAPNFIITASREGETLYIQATGQQQLEIVPTSDSTFRLLVVEASLTFHRDEDGTVGSATLHQNGDQRATRLADDEGETSAWEPSEAELGDFVGRYYSAEIETYYEFAIEDGELTMKHRRLGSSTLTPSSEVDAFAGGGMSYAFERDRNDEVIGFYLANTRTRDVRFERVP